MWQGSDDIINSLLQRIGRPKWDRVIQGWEKQSGIKEMGEPVRLTKGTLVIKVKNSACLQVLNMRRRNIIEAFEDDMPGEIRNIRFQLS